MKTHRLVLGVLAVLAWIWICSSILGYALVNPGLTRTELFLHPWPVHVIGTILFAFGTWGIFGGKGR